MNFFDAVKVADANKHIIGKKWKDATIDEIIIVPTDSSQRVEYEKLYNMTLNAQESIAPFMSEDVEVMVLCNKNLIRQGLLLWTSIYNLPKDYNVELKVE